MASELPPQIQNQIQQFQQIQQQAQVVVQQRQSLETQVRDLDRTLEELKNVEEGTTIYRSVGSLLIRAKDVASVRSEIEDQKETYEVRLSSTKKNEERLKERMQSLQRELQAALGGGGGAGGGSA